MGKITVKCDHCGNNIEKREYDIKRTNHNFCNRSCAASYNNKAYPKRYPLSGLKLEHYKGRNYATYKSRICSHAKRVFNNSEREHVCKNCGYTKHIEVAHIKPVSDFTYDNLIDQVNDIDNLIGLCPNCHWEFDNGFLTIKDILGS